MKTFYKYLTVPLLLFLLTCTDDNPVDVRLEVDHKAPWVEWLEPLGGSEVEGETTLKFFVFEETQVDSVSIYLDGYGRDEWRLAGHEARAYSVQWSTIDTPDGVHTLEARAWDAAGNVGVSPSLIVNVKNDVDPPPVDVSPPLVVWRSPAPGSRVSGRVTLRFDALDDRQIDSVQVYVDGLELGSMAEFEAFGSSYSITWQTDSFAEGVHTLEAVAWDSSGNRGSAPAVGLTVLNYPPRTPQVIWVPDDYETIQGAINASQDGDTVRVRAGTYREGLRLISKSIWLESEAGPEQTIIDAKGIGTSGYSVGIIVYGDQTNSTIRGFTVTGEEFGIYTFSEGFLNIYNCILYDDSDYIIGIYLHDGDNKVLNCIFNNVKWGIVVGYVSGEVFNSMFINCNIGYYQMALYENWATFGWNLFWENERDYRVFVRNDEPQESDIFENPLFVEGSYSLQANSPAIDSGNPELKDKDGSRSDIGIYGGLYAY